MSEACTPKQDETDRVLGFFGLSDDLVRQVHADMMILERLSGTQRGASVERLGLALEAETFIHFDDAVRENIDNAVLVKVI